MNIYSEKWRNAYGLSDIEKFEKGLKRGQEEKKEKDDKEEKKEESDFKCDDTPDDETHECVIVKINGNSIYAHSKKDNSEFRLVLGACSNLEIKGDKEIPAIGDYIIFKGKKETHEAEKEAHQAEIDAKKEAQRDAVWAKKESKVYKVKHAVCYWLIPPL